MAQDIKDQTAKPVIVADAGDQSLAVAEAAAEGNDQAGAQSKADQPAQSGAGAIADPAPLAVAQTSDSTDGSEPIEGTVESPPVAPDYTDVEDMKAMAEEHVKKSAKVMAELEREIIAADRSGDKKAHTMLTHVHTAFAEFRNAMVRVI
jgi:predicted lipid-binding transport protein (Tim44 family)